MSLSIFSPAPRPANERQRQRAVDASGILQAPPDPTLHKLVSATAVLFKTPMAALSIVDRDRMWLAARIGIAELETSRSVSFCAHAILNPDEPFVVRNAIEDERFAGNPFVAGEYKVRFCVGMPVLGRSSLPLGALFALDVRPRDGDLPLTRLAALAEQASQAIAEISRTADLTN